MSDVREFAELSVSGEEREPLDNQTLKALELLPQNVLIYLRVSQPSDQRRPVIVEGLELFPERGDVIRVTADEDRDSHRHRADDHPDNRDNDVLILLRYLMPR